MDTKQIHLLAKDKRGQGLGLGGLGTAVVLFGGVAIVMAVVAQILNQINSTQTANSFAANATLGGLNGVNQVTTFLPTIGLVIAATVIIGLVFSALVLRAR